MASHRPSADKVGDASRRDQQRGHGNAEPQHVAHGELDGAVTPAPLVLPRAHRCSPVTIISMPRARMARAKTRRKWRTRAPIRRRAPINEPPSTPSITGMARPGRDEAAPQVDAGTGSGGYADHEVARRGRDLEGQAHGLVKGQHLDCTRADAEKTREHAGAGHDAEAQRHAARGVGDLAGRRRVAAGQAQSAGESLVAELRE